MGLVIKICFIVFLEFKCIKDKGLVGIMGIVIC